MPNLSPTLTASPTAIFSPPISSSNCSSHDFSNWMIAPGPSSMIRDKGCRSLASVTVSGIDASCIGDYCTPDTDVAVYVDGDRFDGNPADIPLTDQTEIAIVIGSPPDSIPADPGF